MEITDLLRLQITDLLTDLLFTVLWSILMCESGIYYCFYSQQSKMKMKMKKQQVKIKGKNGMNNDDDSVRGSEGGALSYLYNVIQY